MNYAVTVWADSISIDLTLEQVTIMVDGKPSTFQKLPMPLPFSRKPCDLREVSGGELCEVYIFKRIEMDALGFDYFASHLLRDADWLKDAWRALPVANARACVMVVAQNRPILFVDTEGSSYARYVGRLG